MEKLKDENFEKLLNIVSGYVYSELEGEGIFESIDDQDLEEVENIAKISIETALEIIEKVAIFDNAKISKAYTLIEQEKLENAHDVIFSK